jgi:hypothetical protein
VRWRVLFLLALTVAKATAAEPPIRISLQPKIAQAPSNVHVKVVIERAPENRWLTLVIDGPDYYRSVTFQVDGEAGPRVYDYWREKLPCGTYSVVAILSRSDGKTPQARENFRLAGFPCVEPDPE